MYLQKNITIIMNVETDLLGSVLVNNVKDFLFLHEYAFCRQAGEMNILTIYKWQIIQPNNETAPSFIQLS